MVCSPVTVRIAPPDSKLTRSPIPERLINSTLSSPSSSVPDPCAKETVLNALKERKKRIVEEEDQIFDDGQENKRRRHDSNGSGHSAFEPLVANGVPASFVPKPGSLKRGPTSQSSEDHLNKRSRTSSVSSLTSTCTGGIPSSSRNAITSSYSSTRGVSQLWKRNGPTSSPFSSPASSRSQTPERPAKKTREEEPCQHSSSLTPLVADKESQGERVADPTTRKQQNSWTSPSVPGSSGQRKRKVPLLPSRRGDQLTLPPPPQLGYSVTAEDLDMEKKASLQWFNKVLEDKTDVPATSVGENTPATQPSFTFTLPAVGATSSAAPPPTAGGNPLLESLKKMQSTPALALPESAGVAATTASSPRKTPSPLTPLSSPPPEPLQGTSSDSKSTATFLGLVPAAPTPPAADAKPPAALQAETPAKAPGPPAPSPTPKQSVLFVVPSTVPSSVHSTVPSSSASLAAPGVSSATPMFKPIFSTPKSESEGPLLSGPSITTAAASSTVPTMTTTATPTFKPIFHLGPPSSMPLPTPFSFKPTTAAATAAATTAPLFAGLVTATSAVASTTASTSTDSASKPAFGFGVNNVSSTGSSAAGSATSSTTLASQPFTFGAPPASAASFTPAAGSVFQFGKPPAMPASTAVTTFGQSLTGAVQAATSSSTTGFSGFGSSLTTSAPATTSPPTLTFNTTTPTFNIPFGSSAKTSLPSYPAATPQPTFGAVDGQQQASTKPALAPSFGSSFTFGSSVAPAPSAAPASAPAQPAFGSSAQSAFGGLKTTASAFGAPASTQPAFGSTTAVFSFGAATTSSFGAPTQTTSSGTSSSVFGSSAPSPFTFGGSAAPAAAGGFGLSVAAPGTSSTSGAFSFGAGQTGTTGTTTPFGGGLSQNTLGAPSQSTPFAFNVASAPDSKPVFGGTSTPTFGQSTPTPGVGTAGGSLSFGATSTPTQGFGGVGPFGSAAPSFSIGAGSKTPGARQRLQARRQHTRKK